MSTGASYLALSATTRTTVIYSAWPATSVGPTQDLAVPNNEFVSDAAVRLATNRFRFHQLVRAASRGAVFMCDASVLIDNHLAAWLLRHSLACRPGPE